MSLHKLLLRQLTRLQLSTDQPPTDVKAWQDFLMRISSTYEETDQERYLIDRSIEISSREMKELNEKIETAQQIAHLGYWNYDSALKKISWSKTLYELFSLDFSKQPPSLEDMLDLTYEQDKPLLRTLINKIFVEGQEYEVEIRLKQFNKSGDFCWFQIAGQPVIEPDKPITKATGIVRDIQNRKKYEEAVKQLNSQLVTSARRAGMADVATSILHNVGNILNSVNVSMGLIREYAEHSYQQKLRAAESLLEKNITHLTEYITSDERGKLLPTYLLSLSNELENNQKIILEELDNLQCKIIMIKDITIAQRSFSGITGLVEEVDVMEQIDLAIKMCSADLESQHIEVIKSTMDNYTLKTDRTKLLQILINLIHNAKDALIESTTQNKKLIIEVKKIKNDIEIFIQDNGIGILSEHVDKIFSLGFTTKETGHGFGLHGSAISANELGGTIRAESGGHSKGATFILTLPLTVEKEGSQYAT